jgi:hypothetical protein
MIAELTCLVCYEMSSDLGGMFFGFACGISTIERLSSAFFGMEEDVWARTKQFVVRFAGLIVSVVTLVTTTAVLLRGDGETNPCPGCTWLSCVPFPPWASYENKWWYCDDCGRVTADIINDPSVHLELNCPSGSTAIVDLSDTEYIDRDELVKKLPAYCREHCLKVD